MTVTTDAKKRVVLPLAKPGDRFDVQLAGEGKMILTRLEPVSPPPANVRIEKRGRHFVGVSDQPINEEALKEALAEFP
jgi:hypothetical protein